ncbi:hypothetical protein ACFLYB_06890 [Chloroflexota bacterium]
MRRCSIDNNSATCNFNPAIDNDRYYSDYCYTSNYYYRPNDNLGWLATRGINNFNGACSFCHGLEGAGGSGPAIIGTTLKSFGTARGLFDYTSTQIP